MKGLKQYVEKYGWHFTEKLALDAIPCRWSASEVSKSIESMVYYNVSEATFGDIVYLTNYWGLEPNKVDFFKWKQKSKRRCLKNTIHTIENVYLKGIAFNTWVDWVAKDFDLTPYI